MKIHHIGYLTKNTMGTVSGFLGLGYVVEKPMQYDKVRNINITFMINEGYRVEIIEPVDASSPFWEMSKRYRNTPYHFCYLTDKISREIDTLQKKGYMVVQEPAPAFAIDNQKVAFLIHRNMGIIELLENCEVKV